MFQVLSNREDVRQVVTMFDLTLLELLNNVKELWWAHYLIKDPPKAALVDLIKDPGHITKGCTQVRVLFPAL